MSVISFKDFQNKYRFDCQLSQGSFGRVCRIQEIKTKKYFALKKITVKQKQQLEDIENQIHFLLHFRHPFVVQIKQTYNIQIQNGYAKPIWQVGIILQLAKCSLEQIIRMKKPAGTFQFILQQISGLIRILFILQQQNIVHRDIKPANILIFQGNDNCYRWKLADFGLALNVSKNGQNDNFAGSFEYASPKLKRKFKYPNLKIKTNHFKDDVYSLGITLLQTITGLRNYNNVGYQKLRQICDNRKLVDLIDIMLEQDQQKRPCFKQLMILIQKDLKLSKQLDQMQNKKEHINMEKHQYNKISSFQNMSKQNENIYDKTIVKNEEKKNKITIIKTNKPIQCLTNLDGAIMCGCDNGQLIFMLNNTVVQCGVIHKRNVSQFFVDHRGNIWSVGGDSIIKKWSKNHLIKALISQVKQVKIIQNRFLRKNQQKTIFSLQIKPTYFQTIQIHHQHKCGISSIYAFDQNNFIIGYYNGFVYAKWKGMQFNSKIFTKPVTAIKPSLSFENFWMCSLDGQTKILNSHKLTLLNKFFFTNNCSFVDLYVNHNHEEQLVTLLTLDGRHLIINNKLECIFEHLISKKTILSSIQNSRNCYVLMESGEIIDLNQQRVIELGSKGWCSLSNSHQNQLIAANFLGQIAILQL